MTEAFIARWEKSGAAERANYQPFLIGLCGALGVDPPDPSLPDPEDEALLWPKELAGQIALVRDMIARVGWQPTDGVKALSKHFVGVRAPTIQRHVDALVALGQV